jgi:hypothetical protein
VRRDPEDKIVEYYIKNTKFCSFEGLKDIIRRKLSFFEFGSDCP